MLIKYDFLYIEFPKLIINDLIICEWYKNKRSQIQLKKVLKNSLMWNIW